MSASGEPLGVANRDIAQIESKAPIGCLSLLDHPHFDYGHAVTSPSSQVITAEIVQVNVGTGVYPDLLNRTCSRPRFGYVSVSRAGREATLLTKDLAKLRKMFAFLEDIEDPEELRMKTSCKAHTSTDGRKGTWSLSVTTNRRLTFRIDTAEREIYDVNLEDYHLAKGEETIPIKNPLHPGDFIWTEIIEAAGLVVTMAAIALRVSRPTLSSLLNGKTDLSVDMALRIKKAFGVKMDRLMRMQSSYDIAQTRKREKQIRVPRISLLAAKH